MLQRRRRIVLLFLLGTAVFMVILAWYTSNGRNRVATGLATTSSSTLSPTTLATPVADLHRVDWPNVTIPGQLCVVPGFITLRNGEATASSQRWGQVHVGMQGTDAVYGDLDGDGDDEAAVTIWCDNGGGTAAGQLAQGLVVFDNPSGQLRTIGTVTPQHQPADVHTSFIDSLTFARGRLVAHELWYRNTDATCCPSGKATTVWKYTSGRLVPGNTQLTS
jgi:hypothetical protein